MSRKGCPNKISTKLLFICGICKKQWMDKRFYFGKQKFCSNKCAAISRINGLRKRSIGNKWGKGKRTDITRINISISKKGKPNPNGSIAKKGIKNPIWKGGISPINKRIRRSAEFFQWRKKVFERDKYVCQICFKVGGELHPDHIKQFAFYPKLRFQLSNGRTLYKGCHMKTPTWGNRKVTK